jgi:hypothetical protein
MSPPCHHIQRSAFVAALVAGGLLVLSAIKAQTPSVNAPPEAEFHMARLIYTIAGDRGGFRFGPGRPWWAIDYPEAEDHFLHGVRRLTRIDTTPDSRHVSLLDDTVFDYPWLFAQQVGRWQLSDEEIGRLREYLQRGGFLVVDDFHGEYEWQVFQSVMQRVFPELPIVELPASESLLHILYDLDQRTQIPGRRHLRRAANGEIVAQLAGPPHWRGIYDDEGRLLVAINFNMDMGDAWQHADDPVYPEPMTALAYRFGINYILYAMTH